VSSRLRGSALAVLALAALPVLSACGTSPGAAAVVGSDRITTGDLQTQVKESLSNGELQKQQGFDQAAFTRELLGHLIAVKLVNAAAVDRNVTVTSQDVSAQQAEFVQQAGSLSALQTQAASSGITASQLPGFIRYAALQQKLSTALVNALSATPAQLAAEYQKDIDQFDQLEIAQIEVKTKAEAESILNQVKNDPSSFATLAAAHSLDATTKDKGGLVGYVGRSAVENALGGKPANPGTFAIAHTTGNYTVVHIIKRRTKPESAVTAQLKASLFASQEQSLLEKAISAEATKLGVHVSPRYGRWDNTTDAVVAAPNPVSSSSSG
jgi:PPIC-type PPIASE domain/SurA N-terminal domain